MQLALFEPDIPQNTGTILRLCACLDVVVHLIEPAGFSLSDRAFKRAGLDYAARAKLMRHRSYDAFLAAAPEGRIVLLTTKAACSYLDFAYFASDILMLGRESAGVSARVRADADAAVKIPLAEGLRSLNVAVAAAVVLGEALRQTDGFAKLHA